MLTAPTPGSYLEDRALIFDRLRRLEEEAKKDTEQIGELKARIAKFNLDVNEAHKRIRGLMNEKDALLQRITRLEIRAGYIAAGAGTLAGILIELAKWAWPLVHH